MSSAPTWGVVATIKAPAQDILNFAAHYLDLGAHRVFVYLDEDNPEARTALKRHPKCRVILTDENYWKRRRRAKGRPGGHQHRQVLNATHCYSRDPQVDWLFHTDVDEFLQPLSPLPAQLAAIPPGVLSARVRPIEAMQPDPAHPPPPGQIWCKGFDPILRVRREQTATLYPRYGEHLNGGFLSHVAGKVFVRTGRQDITLRIHSAFVGKARDFNPFDLFDCQLVHLHAPSWDDWQARFRYRLNHGSYRPDLDANARHSETALTMHQLFSMLEAEGGEDALRAFYEEVCIATPGLRAQLQDLGHLHAVTLDLDATRARHFPNFA